MFIQDSSGKKSLTATLAYVSFIVVMLKVLVSGASIAIGSFSYTFGVIDAAVIAAILGPTLGSYTMRRWNDPPETDAGSKPHDGGA